MRLWLTILAVCGLVACQPSDQRVKNARQLLDEGEILTFDQPGFRHAGCKPTAPDWTLRVSDQNERFRLVAGSQRSVIMPGVYNCLRVGSVVDVEIFKNPDSSGKVLVSRISWARADKVTKSRLQGKFFASSEQFNAYMDAIRRRLEYSHEAYVAIVDFVYVEGSAVDEKAIRDADKSAGEGDGFEETMNDGDSLSRCQKGWTDILVDSKFQDAILQGQLASWYGLGQRNCLKQGQLATIKSRLDDPQGVGTIKITKIKKFRISALDAKYFKLNHLDFAVLKESILQDNLRKNEEFMTVVDFELQASKQVSP